MHWKKSYTLFLLIFASIFIFHSCSVVYFSNPQPKNRKDQKHIPGKLHGNWYIEGDSVMIFREGYTTTDTRRSYFVAPDWDPSLSMSQFKKQLHDIDKVDTASVDDYKMNRDTLFYTEHTRETILLSDSFKLRKVGRNIYSANFLGDHGWMTVIIQKKDGSLHFNMLETNEMELVREITGDTAQAHYSRINENPESTDSDYYLTLDLTSRQIKKLVAEGGFRDTVMILKPEFQQSIPVK